MATRQRKTAEAAETGTALTKWDEELARQAEAAAGMEKNVGGGQFFSMQGGQLKFNDNPVPNNQMAVIVLDHVLENVFYDGDYDPSNPAPPTCFAFDREETDMAPHEVVVAAGQAQSEACRDCPMNQWGSADKGRGKACRNTRRLAMIPAGTLDANGRFSAFDDEDHFASANEAYMRLPVTSVKGWASFVKQVAGTLRRPPHGIFTKIRLEPDPKTQFRVVFEPIAQVPNNLLATIMKRHEASRSTIEFPYMIEEREEPQPKGRGAARGKAPAVPAKRGRKF